AMAEALISINARPAPLELDPRRTAVLVVDMQNDFSAEGGLLARAGVDIAPIQAIVPQIARVLTAARRAALPVIYLTMEFRPDLADLGAPDSPNALNAMLFGVLQL